MNAPANTTAAPGARGCGAPSWFTGILLDQHSRGIHRATPAEASRRAQLLAEHLRHTLDDLEHRSYRATLEDDLGLDLATFGINVADDEPTLEELHTDLLALTALLALLRRAAGHHGTPAAVATDALTVEDRRAHLTALEAHRAAIECLLLAGMLLALELLATARAHCAIEQPRRSTHAIPAHLIDARRVLPDRAPPVAAAAI